MGGGVLPFEEHDAQRDALLFLRHDDERGLEGLRSNVVPLFVVLRGELQHAAMLGVGRPFIPCKVHVVPLAVVEVFADDELA